MIILKLRERARARKRKRERTRTGNILPGRSLSSSMLDKVFLHRT